MYCGQPRQNRTSHHAESCQLCLHHSIISQRAHPKNRQVPSQTIGVHLQSSQTSCFTRFCTPLTPAAPDPTRRASPWAGFFFLFASASGPPWPAVELSLASRSPTSASKSVARLSLPQPPTTRILTVASFPPFPLPNSQSHQPVTLSLRHHSPRIVFFLHLRAIFFCPV